jgi:hypothetical protein
MPQKLFETFNGNTVEALRPFLDAGETASKA